MNEIDLKEVVKLCIELFDSNEASTRIVEYIKKSLELKEQEIELKNLLKKQN